MFDDGAETIMERLTKAADAIGEILDDAMGKLAQKVRPLITDAFSWHFILNTHPRSKSASRCFGKVLVTTRRS